MNHKVGKFGSPHDNIFQRMSNRYQFSGYAEQIKSPANKVSKSYCLLKISSILVFVADRAMFNDKTLRLWTISLFLNTII